MIEQGIIDFFNSNIIEKALNVLRSGDVTIQDHSIHAEQNNKKVHLKATDNGYSFYYSEITDNSKEIKEFKDFCESLDGDIFTTACEIYQKTGNSLQNLDELMKSNSINSLEKMNLFKDCVKQAVSDKIDSLKHLL